MVSVCYIKARHFTELLRHGLDVSLIRDHPELMTEAIVRGNEIIFRCRLRILLQQIIQYSIVRISKEYRFHVGVAYTYMFHAILFLVTTSQLVLLDVTRKIIIDKSTDNKPILCLAIHRLGIYIVMLLVILHQPSLFLELLELLNCTLVNAWIILAGSRLEVDFRLDNMIQTLLIVACFCTCFFRVEYVIRTTCDRFYKILRWTNTLERFDNCHSV